MTHVVPLGQLLVQSGVLSQNALDEVLEVQKTSDRKRLGDLLAERNLVEPRRLAQILSYQLSCPWLSLTNAEISPSLIELFPRELALKHTVMPVHIREIATSRALYVATHDPTDEVGLGECARAVNMMVRPMVAITYEIRQALARYYGAPIPSLTTAPITLQQVTAKQPKLDLEGLVNGHRPAPPPKPPALPLKPQAAAPVAAAAPTSELTPAPEPRTTTAPTPPTPAVVATPAAPDPGPPIVLLLNAPDRFREQCEIAAKSVEATVAEGSLMNAADKAWTHKPAAIVVTDDIYSFDRSGLNRLAIESDALLVVWSDEVEASQLEPLLQGAIKRWRRLR